MSDPIPTLVIVGVAVWLVAFSIGTAVYAAARERSAPVWALYGAVLGPIALVLLDQAPPGRCMVCGSRGVGWQPLCSSCSSGDLPAHAAIQHEGDIAPLPEPTSISTAASETTPTSARRTRSGTSQATPPPAPDRTVSAATHDVSRAATSASALPPTGATTTAGAPGEEQDRVLATAVYAGGSLPLPIGHRYILAIDGDQLRVKGPVDRDPNATVFTCPLVGLDVVGSDERLTISGGSGTRRSVAAFVSLSGDSADGLERALAGWRSRPEGPR